MFSSCRAAVLSEPLCYALRTNSLRSHSNESSPPCRPHTAPLITPCWATLGHKHQILIQLRRYKACFFSLDPSTSQIEWSRNSGRQQLLSVNWLVIGTFFFPPTEALQGLGTTLALYSRTYAWSLQYSERNTVLLWERIGGYESSGCFSLWFAWDW